MGKARCRMLDGGTPTNAFPIETEKTELQTGRLETNIGRPKRILYGPESSWISRNMRLEEKEQDGKTGSARVCLRYRSGDHMTIEPEKRDILGKLNARIAPVGALIGTLSGVITGIAKISEYGWEWSDVILLVLTIIAYMSFQIVFFSLFMYALLARLLSKFIGDNGAAILALVIGTIASVSLTLSQSPHPDMASAFVGLLVVACGAWLLIKKLMLQPSGGS